MMDYSFNDSDLRGKKDVSDLELGALFLGACSRGKLFFQKLPNCRRANGVYSNPALCKLHSHGLRQPDNSELRCGIGVCTVTSGYTGYARDIYNGSGFHVRDRVFDPIECSYKQ